jgi:hypothetical protein
MVKAEDVEISYLHRGCNLGNLCWEELRVPVDEGFLKIVFGDEESQDSLVDASGYPMNLVSLNITGSSLICLFVGRYEVSVDKPAPMLAEIELPIDSLYDVMRWAFRACAAKAASSERDRVSEKFMEFIQEEV